MDLAGSPYRMESAINHFMPGWTAKRVQQSETFAMGFPRGLPWSQLGELSEQADVVHIHHIYFAKEVIPQLSGNAKVVVSVRGSPDRENKTPVPKGVDLLHSCHWDLLGIYPQATVIPNFILSKDVDPHRVREATVGGPVRVFQPVAHRLKHPKDYAKVRDTLSVTKEDKKAFDFRSMPGKHCRVNNFDQLAEMAKSDIVWDNLQGNSGNVSMEAMSLGALPITTLNDATRKGLQKFFHSMELPHLFKGGPDEIAQTLRRVAADPEGLAAARYVAFQFWNDNWRDEIMMGHWKKLYEDLL